MTGNETSIPLELSGEEVRIVILKKLEDRLMRTGNLSDQRAYSSFKAKITVEMVLDDHGLETKEVALAEASEGELSEDAPEVENVEVEIEPAPPNMVRAENDLPVPVIVDVNGKTEIKKVHYQPKRGPGRPKKVQ